MTSDRARLRGFTLLELLVVVLLIGLIGAVIVGGVARSSAGATRLAAMNAVVAELATARIEAMRTSQPRALTVTLREGELAIASEGRPERILPHPGLVLLNEDMRVVDRLQAKFDRDGRTRARRW